jgi:endonuclease YncB( thermonuclease family)
MAKTTTRRRKSSSRSKAKGNGSALSWAIVGAIAVGGIAIYDNWKSVKPMLAAHAPAVARPVSVTRSEPERESEPRQTASIAPIPRPVPPAPVPVPIPSKGAAVPEKAVPVSISPAQTESAKAAFGYCGQGEHINCVADGGTFWYKGERIVIADIVSPAIDTARCDGERRVGFAAKLKLLNILNAGSFSMNSAGQPGKAGAPHVISRDGRSIGLQLINEGLARKPGSSGGWCA